MYRETELVMDTIKVDKTKRYKTIEIGTGNSSIGQLALYQKCGFRIIGVDMDFFLLSITQHKFLRTVFSTGIRFVYLKIYRLKKRVNIVQLTGELVEQGNHYYSVSLF